MAISEKIKKDLLDFLKKHRTSDLLTAYFFYIERQLKLSPVACLQNKKVYKGAEDAIQQLETLGLVWRETEIKIGYGPPTVNEQTKRVYICPFTGKAFADNTHPNPQDAIYDWVSQCPENRERIGGVPAKRFFVSDDPGVIKNYVQPRKEPISKIVFSSATSGKLYNSKETIIEEFRRSYLKPMSLLEVQNQNRFELEDSFLKFVQNQLGEDKIAAFVEALAADEAFVPYVTKWVESDES